MSNMTVNVGGQNIAADARTFKSGSTGYFGSGKVTVDGVRYQVTVNIVAIGSSPAAQAKRAEKVESIEKRINALVEKRNNAASGMTGDAMSAWKRERDNELLALLG